MEEEGEREDEVGEEKRGKERNIQGEKEIQHRLMTSLRERNEETRYRVCCSHSTKWKEFGRYTEATAS